MAGKQQGCSVNAHNAAPAEYPGCAALAYALGNKSKIPSTNQCAGCAKVREIG